MSLYNDLTDVLTPYANKIKEVNESLENNMSGTRNLFDKAKAVNKAIIMTGDYINATGRWTSDYIPIHAGRSYCFYKCDTYYRALFDAEKVPVSGGFTVRNPYVAPYDGYIRVCVLTEDLDSAIVEESETLNAYIPAKSFIDYVARENINKNHADIEELQEDINQNHADIEELQEDINQNHADIEALQEGGLNISDAVIEGKVANWLTNHPEATTTIANKSITLSKFTDGDVPYVTPELFGAVGDGETDDTEAIQDAIDFCMLNHKTLRFSPKTYMVSVSNDRYDITVTQRSQMKYALIIKGGSIHIDLNGATLKLLDNDVDWYMIILVILSDGVCIENGTIIGDADTFTNRTGSWDSSKDIRIWDCKNLTLNNLILKKSKGDAISFSGVERGTNYNYPFEDFYMNISIKNCIFSESYRNGITISRARGIVFEGCLIEKTQGTTPELGVDIEPWYGQGNVYDVTFINCCFRENSMGDIYAQSSHDVRVINCIGTGQCGMRNSEHVEVIGSKFSKYYVVGTKCEIIDSISTDETTGVSVNCYAGSAYIGTLSVIVENCDLNGRISTQDTETLFESLIVRGCKIRSRESSPIVIANSENMFKEIVIENNSMYMSAEGANGSSGCIRIANGHDIVVRDNNLFVDSKNMTGSVFGYLSSFKNAVIEGNVLEYREEDEETYTHTPTELMRLEGGFSIMRNNIFNYNGIIPSNRTPFYAIANKDGTTKTFAIFEKNVFYGVTDVKNGTNITLSTEEKNRYFLKPSSIMSGYKISNNVATADETAEIYVYPVTAGEELYLYLSADFEDCTYRWQSSYAVSESSSANVIGTPITGEVAEKVTVPTGATHLAVSRLINSEFSKVERRS